MQLRVCAVKVVNIACTTSRNAWAANIAIDCARFSHSQSHDVIRLVTGYEKGTILHKMLIFVQLPQDTKILGLYICV